MKIRKRFNSLFLAIALVCIIIPIILFVSYNKLNELQNLRSQVLETQINFDSLIAYPGNVLAYGFEISKLASNWESHIDRCSNSIEQIDKKSSLYGVPKSVKDNINGIVILWKTLSINIDRLSQSYEDIQNTKYDRLVESAINSGGLQKGYDISLKQKTNLSLTINVNNINTYSEMILHDTDKFQNFINNTNIELLDRIEKYSSIVKLFGFLIAIIASIVVFVLILAGTRGIIVKIKDLQKFANGIFSKDLTVRVTSTSDDEIGALAKDLNDTVKGLDSIIHNVKYAGVSARLSSESIHRAATETATATKEIGKNIGSLDTEFSKLMAIVAEVMESLNSMSKNIESLLHENKVQSENITLNTDEIKEMTKFIESIQQMSAEKALSAEEIQKYVADGDNKITSTNNLLREVSSSLEEIQNLVSVIGAISDQTNILSMNAAIESAHAGEAGKGFAVVAEEIRTLAETTSDSAKKIKKTVNEITNKVTDANSTSDEASSTFDEVSTKVHDMLDALHEIAEKIRDVEQKTQNVNKRTSEIAASSSGINVQYKSLATQQTSISTEMSNMQNVFKNAMVGLKEIDSGSTGIISQMNAVTGLSDETATKMQNLDKLLSEFTTTEENQSKSQEQSTDCEELND
ncbi:MAG: hypothetical protein BKP49_04010 [Treponema sp. CETP13]|nr:MAG: hypothetical protein BKP49_04010 [Treponema sp. CETP13]